MSAEQLALFPAWWRRIERFGRWVRYQCARCELWSTTVPRSSAPPGACARCVSLPWPAIRHAAGVEDLADRQRDRSEAA